jgi:Mrp family chromosome partitioning ATPase
MADLWKTTDRGPTTPLPVPGALLNLEPTRAHEMAEDDDVPFIEVGGPRPVMHHLEPIAPKSTLTPIPSPAKPGEGKASIPIISRSAPTMSPRSTIGGTIAAPAIMTVRFEAIRGSEIIGGGFGTELIAFHQPNHAVSVQYRSLIAEIVTQLPGNKPRLLMFTAAKPGAGATTVALNLGISLARQEGSRIIVTDANFAQPDMAKRLGLPATPGLRDVVARHSPLTWSIQETTQSGMFALTAGRDDAPPATELAPIIEQLRGRHDWTIVDAGPWDERLVPLAETCDAIYLVHTEEDPAARELIASILNATGRLRGCIVTRK